MSTTGLTLKDPDSARSEKGGGKENEAPGSAEKGAGGEEGGPDSAEKDRTSTIQNQFNMNFLDLRSQDDFRVNFLRKLSYQKIWVP